MKHYTKYLFKYSRKRLRLGIISNLGRNFTGRITVHHHFSGNKHQYRLVDFVRRINCKGIVFKIIKDSKWTAYLGNIAYYNGLVAYIIIAEGVARCSKIYVGSLLDPMSYDIGSSIVVKNLNLFTVISNIEKIPYKGSTLSRSAGSSATLLSKKGNKVVLKLKSGWNITILENCLVTLGITSNMGHREKNIGKAGKSYALGIKPKVRGIAKNPCDHPHGGGEGRKSGRRAAVSPWGWLTKNTPSLKTKKDLKKKKLFKKLR